jgi:hypothetical protein
MTRSATRVGSVTGFAGAIFLAAAGSTSLPGLASSIEAPQVWKGDVRTGIARSLIALTAAAAPRPRRSIRELRRFCEMLRPGREARFQTKMP